MREKNHKKTPDDDHDDDGDDEDDDVSHYTKLFWSVRAWNKSSNCVEQLIYSNMSIISNFIKSCAEWYRQ